MAIDPTKTPVPANKAAEREAAQQDGFLREVDEALREEQMVNAFKRFAKPVGAAIAVGLVALGGYWYWDHSTKAAASARSEKAVLAFDKMQAGQLDAAARELAGLVNEGPIGSRAVAAMNLAAITLEQGKADEAAKQFAAIAANAEMPKPYRDLATIREVSIRYDSMKPDEVIAKLKPMAVPGNAFFGSAGELLGMAYLEAGKPDLAGALFAQIGKDESVPKSIRGRARQVAGGLGYDGGVDVPTDAPSDEGSAAAAGAKPQAQPQAPAQPKP